MSELDDVAPLGTVPSVAAHISAAVFDGETVLYDSVASRPLLLNVSAGAVWAAIDGHRNVAEIAAVVAAEFGAEASAVRHDVAVTIARFAAFGLVVASHTERHFPESNGGNIAPPDNCAQVE